MALTVLVNDKLPNKIYILWIKCIELSIGEIAGNLRSYSLPHEEALGYTIAKQ
jgi:hypothetical protein